MNAFQTYAIRGRNPNSLYPYSIICLLFLLTISGIDINEGRAAKWQYTSSVVTVLVFSPERQLLDNATVTMTIEGSNKVILIPYDESTQSYKTDSVPSQPFNATVTVRAKGYEPQSRYVVLGECRTIGFNLGKRGSLYTYVYEGLYPYEPHPNRYAIYYDSPFADSTLEFIRSLGLTIINKRALRRHHELERPAGNIMIVGREEPFDPMNSDVLRALRGNKMTMLAGPYIGSNDTCDIELTNTFTIEFKRAPVKEIEEVLKDSRFKSVQYYYGRYKITLDAGVGEGIHGIMHEIMKNPAVLNVSAEPIMIVYYD